ncbi:MAG: Rrf2 family transcriptional regulator [Deltaproteobacteria bacterium]|nr:Rrf2 family transcriptional regulator [Deltaproteobacteria bacterium]
MRNIINISEAFSLALHTMACLASEPKQRRGTHEVALQLGVSEAHLAKVMRRLGRAGLVSSRRGPGGGFKLARPAATIRLMDVYKAVEGGWTSPGCLLGQPACEGECLMGGLLQELDRLAKEYLEDFTLDRAAPSFEKGAMYG